MELKLTFILPEDTTRQPTSSSNRPSEQTHFFFLVSEWNSSRGKSGNSSGIIVCPILVSFGKWSKKLKFELNPRCCHVYCITPEFFVWTHFEYVTVNRQLGIFCNDVPCQIFETILMDLNKKYNLFAYIYGLVKTVLLK